ncbi:kinesin associated protein 3 [Dermatophagoides pteronyssinus]|uniref:kinesin associated protein 3 n=1 Tax=Dermatophagoides pteronyssinus TaxID=6956 RepID=UPI003F6688C1
MNSYQNKNVIFKRIQADLKNKCLIVYYDSISEQKQQIFTNCKQIIKINKPANKNLNIEKIARKILRKSHVIPYIHYYELVGQLIELDRKCSITPASYDSLPLSTYNFLSFNLTSDVIEHLDTIIPASIISIKDLDSYIEFLYEELDDKIKGAYLILKSLSQVDCMIENLCKNDTLLCALSRVFREDGKKSLELSICIACIFGHFSKYSDFHFAITNYKVGSTCLELIYYEMLRQESWLKELMKTRENLDNHNDNDDGDKDDERNDYERLSYSHQSLINKQNIFFRYSLYILLNISEDIKLEYKIHQKGIVSILGKLLERNNQELLLIVILFLKKLSVFIEDKIQIKELSIYKNLTPLLYLDNELLIINTLKLLYNLMIDRDIRLYLVRSGIVPKLISFFLKDHYTSVIVSIFYLISCETKFIPIFKQNEQMIDLLMEKIFINIDYKPIIIRLLTNLAINEDLASMMVINNKNKNRFHELINSAIVDNNIHLYQLCRNITCHRNDNIKFDSTTINSLFEMIKQSNNNMLLEIQIECLAILTNLAPVIDIGHWIRLLEKYSFIDFIKNYRITDKKTKQSEFLSYLLNMVAKAIITSSPSSNNDTELVNYLIDHQWIDHLLNIINLNQENDQIISNAIYCLYVLIKQIDDDQKIMELCQNNKLTDYLIELMYDKNYRIKTLCNFTLDLLADNCDSEQANNLAKRICSEKFNAHNNKWLSMVRAQSSSSESNNLLEDMFIYPDLFLKMDVLCDDDSNSETFSDENVN